MSAHATPAATTRAMHPANPAAALRARFAEIAATRMAGLPVCNPALQVEVVAMQDWQGAWLGALVTPWAVSLVLLPGRGERFCALAVGQSQEWDFPSGRYEFVGSSDEILGPYQSCSLASPAFEFADPEGARAFAAAALAALLQPAATAPARDAARLDGRSVAAQPLSRRAFLRGALFGADR